MKDEVGHGRIAEVCSLRRVCDGAVYDGRGDLGWMMAIGVLCLWFLLVLVFCVGRAVVACTLLALFVLEWGGACTVSRVLGAGMFNRLGGQDG